MSSSASNGPDATQQRIAFDYLAGRARIAHQEGDGILVNHLCATALSQLTDYSKSGKLLLPVTEISWALVFPLFWLIDKFMLDTISQELPRLKSASPEETELIAFLNAYHELVFNPVRSFDPSKIRIDDPKMGWVASERRVEHEILVTHLVELLWFHGPTEPQWSSLSAVWRTRSPDWLADAILKTEQRQSSQTSLTVLGAKSTGTKPVFSTEDAWLAELWECTLDCNWARIDQILIERVPKTTMEMPLARFLFDARHFNRMHGIWGDDQATGLTRRRLAVTSFPKLGFDQFRSSHCERTVSGLFRGGKQPDDSQLVHAYRLAMLSELEALRFWDRFDWTQAINAQSRLAFLMAMKNPKLSSVTFHGIILAIQSFSYESRKPIFQDAIFALDFAPVEERKRFFSLILAAQDVYAYHVLHLLGDFADAIPDDFLEPVADWSLKYKRIAKDKTLPGSKTIPLEFWRWIFPYLPESNAIWGKLASSVTEEAKNPITWQIDDGLILEFLSNAPERSASAVARIMLGITVETDGDRLCRWSILSEALTRRPGLSPEFGAKIVATAPTPSDRYRVTKALNIAFDAHGEENAARKHMCSLVFTCHVTKTS